MKLMKPMLKDVTKGLARDSLVPGAHKFQQIATSLLVLVMT